MATKKKATPKKKKKAPPKKKPPQGDPFSVVLIKPAEKTYVNPQTGEVSKLFVDPSGLTSYWISTGEFVPYGIAVPTLPEMGGIPAEVANKLKSAPMDSDSILAASTAAFVNSNAGYNVGMKDRFTDAALAWQKRGRVGQPPESPMQPEMNPARWISGKRYFRPVNFAEVYYHMKSHGSGKADQSPAAEIKFPPEVEFNQ